MALHLWIDHEAAVGIAGVIAKSALMENPSKTRPPGTGNKRKEGKLTVLQAVYAILIDAGRPMSALAMIAYADENCMPLPTSAVQRNTVINSRVSVHILEYGNRALFVRVSPGVYAVRPASAASVDVGAQVVDANADSAPDAD